MKKNYAEQNSEYYNGKIMQFPRESVAFKRLRKKKTLENGLFGIIPLYLFLVNLYIFVDCFQTFYRCYFIRRLNIVTENDRRLYF